ncbi:MAG: alpha-amylase [Chloroflexi bacterium]|nr:alpha-amylase [Chloroflexota bacterium]
MTSRSPQFHVYEINTWAWLHALSTAYGRTITLANVPAEAVAHLASMDAVWLMGVWERSPAGRQVALEHPGLKKDYAHALPDHSPEDVIGSPYSVRRYEVDERLGGTEGLAKFRKQITSLGLRLILDFVPNHVAIDHPWTIEHPDALVPGHPEHVAANPESYFQANGHILAHGRDPYFPAWTDTAQVNAFSQAYRDLSIDTLKSIASQCDGVRCDMAMLLVNRIFMHTWEQTQVGAPPSTEYWEIIIPAVREAHPDFLFMAEVYWDMEYELQQQGFDYCYDKRLYDRLVHQDAPSVEFHLVADLSYQNQLMRFIENHDEPRALSALGLPRSRMGAVLIATLPGGKLWHDGQFEGRHIRLPVQLGRFPDEDKDSTLDSFYRRLLTEATSPVYRQGTWELRHTTPAWPENPTHHNLVAYSWRQEHERRLVVVNFSSHRSQAYVSLPNLDLDGQIWALTDILDDSVYERNGRQMAGDGLYIDLQPWTAHIFNFNQAG